MLRRNFLRLGAGVGALSVAGCAALDREPDTPTQPLDAATAEELAERFAPIVYFDEHEEWLPTDPREYESTEDDTTIVDGFTALNSYARQLEENDTSPSPAVFYNGVRYQDSSLGVIQYWMYSVFDQFTTNFHWHDWEVLHVFVDLETQTPKLYVASSHSRNVPNNEFIEPEADTQPRILAELGSHSSALSLNEDHDRFQRLPTGGQLADITNSTLEGLDALATIPLAYGLPRDEGSRLPYVVPELDGEPLYNHEQLPAVTRDHLVDDSLTIRSYDALSSPPRDLPERQTGVLYDYAGHETEDAAIGYDLIPSSELEHISEFSGPQLSFEFNIPGFIEDRIAGHITTTKTPWQDPRYTNPAADISDPRHREQLADDYPVIGDPAETNLLVVEVTEAVQDEDAPEDEGLQTDATDVESIAFIESEPEAIPSFTGIVAMTDPPTGDHQFTVNSAGTAPFSEAVTITESSDVTQPGVDGEIPLVAREHAIKLEVDPRETDTELASLAVEDDFAGRLYDAPLTGPDAVYLHQGGAYTTEVRDTDDAIGAARVNPTTSDSIRLDDLRTGKASLASYIADLGEETETAVRNVADDDDTTSGPGGDGQDNDRPESPVTGLAQSLAAMAEAARLAAERAAAGERAQADNALKTVVSRLDRVTSRLADARGAMPADLVRAVSNRVEQAQRRVDQAQASEKL